MSLLGIRNVHERCTFCSCHVNREQKLAEAPRRFDLENLKIPEQYRYRYFGVQNNMPKCQCI